MGQVSVLVTGATGQVGGLTVRRLVERGYHVRAMARRSSARSNLAGLPIEWYEGDLSEPESLPGAVAGVDYVVHCAARLGDWGPIEGFRAINVHALDHLVQAALGEGRLKRWVQISSLGVYPARHHYGTDESVAADLTGLDGYTRTKAEAEALLESYVEKRNFPAVILRPGFIYGAGDRHVVPRLVKRLRSGVLKMIGPTGRVLNNTCVGNLVDATLLALEKSDAEVRGQIFNIRDERLVSREEFIGALADHLGMPLPRRLPEWLPRLVVKPIEWQARLRGAADPPLLTGAQIKFMTLNLDFSIAKAKERLGYCPRIDFREGIQDALRWAVEQGLVPRRGSSEITRPAVMSRTASMAR